jgi:molybdate-binding protein
MRREANLHDAVLMAFARREVGLLVAPDNPFKLTKLEDVAARSVRLAVRPPGAGAQLLLEALLRRAGIGKTDVKAVSPPCPTGPDVAQAIRVGRADCGIAVRAVAASVGLGFIPILWEHFDLVVRQRHYFRPQFQAFVSFLAGDALAVHARDSGGYDLTGIGQIRFAP